MAAVGQTGKEAGVGKAEGKRKLRAGFQEQRCAVCAGRGGGGCREWAARVCGGPWKTTEERGFCGSHGRLLIRACAVSEVMLQDQESKHDVGDPVSFTAWAG